MRASGNAALSKAARDAAGDGVLRADAAAIVPRLVTLLDDPSPNSRFAKIEALLAVDPSQTPAVLRALEPMLTHELDAVRAQAAKLREKLFV